MNEVEHETTHKQELQVPHDLPPNEPPRVKITKLSEKLELSDDAADQPCWG